ncbi:MAG: hypothetical protein HYU75_21050 [Betaproteobacteria bacterium]|nr:hypothetical protein [Betaproteobacteria bacterium]
MGRQINLYLPAFRRERKPFSAAWTVAALLVTVAVMSAYYALAAQQLQPMRTQRKDAEAQLKQLREQVLGAAKGTQKTKSKALEDQVARAEGLLKGRQELLDRLKGGELGNRDGYTRFLKALARQHLEGVWLTSIEITGPRDEFALHGRATRADLLPEYIRMLRKEEAFRGKPIGTLALREREIEPKAEKSAPAGAAEPAGAKAQPAAKASAPALRVVEFTIGTDLVAAAEAGKR